MSARHPDDATKAARRRRDEDRFRSMGKGATIGVFVAILVLFGAIFQAQRARPDSSGPDPESAGRHGLPVGPSGAPVTVRIYEDPLCPTCRHLEEAIAPTLAQEVARGRVRVDYVPVAILDDLSSDRYSTRAAAALAAVHQAGPGAFEAFHARLYAAQPAEGGPGLSDATLAQLARDSGATDAAVQEAIGTRRYAGWVTRLTDAAARDGINTVPVVLVDGRKVGPEAAAVLAAIAGTAH